MRREGGEGHRVQACCTLWGREGVRVPRDSDPEMHVLRPASRSDQKMIDLRRATVVSVSWVVSFIHSKVFRHEYRAAKKSLYVVARNFCLALPGCCLAKHTKTFSQLCTLLDGRLSPGYGKTGRMAGTGQGGRFSLSGRYCAIEKGTYSQL